VENILQLPILPKHGRAAPSKSHAPKGRAWCLVSEKHRGDKFRRVDDLTTSSKNSACRRRFAIYRINLLPTHVAS
jgi:hypothetical protein